MFRCICLIFLFAVQIKAKGQNLQQKADSILSEAQAIYELEYAAWLSAEILYSRLSLEGIQGYLSYTENDSVKVVYFIEGEKTKFVFSFPTPVDPQLFKINGTERALTKDEKRLAKIRNKALIKIRDDEFFEKHSNPELNLNLTILRKDKRYYCYILPGTGDNSYVPFGSDFLLIYKKRGKLVSSKSFHNNFIPVAIDTENEDEAVLSSFHKHLGKSSPYITATDICTLLLYKNIAKWDTHIVLSEKYASFFSIKEKNLQIITMEEFKDLMQKLGR